MIKEAKEAAIYETQNVDLATFLIFEGVNFLESVRSSSNSKIIVMRFLDPHGKCLDLERVFLRSQFKQYREIQKWLLQKIHQTLRS